MYGKDNARFKSVEQAEAIKEILKKDSDILVILPTGGGKTLTYQLPMFIEQDMTTVVIVPYVVLVEQVEEQCKQLKVSYEVWTKDGQMSENARVIITGVDQAILPEFQNLLIQLESTKRLARIVLDECHTVLCHREFRPVIRRLGGVVRCVSVPLVLLTATLPPTMEDRVRILLGCEHLKIIRRIEDRKELKYSVKVVGNEVKTMRDLNGEVEKVIVQAVRSWKKEDRGLIYCLTRKWAEELALYLNEKFKRENVGVYHARMGEKERQEALKDWKSGKFKFLVATSALGAGLDYGQVRLVIHHGHAQNLIDFSQESGRGGRDGLTAKSVTLFWKGLEKETGWIAEEGKEDMIRWMESDDCRKKSLSVYLHGSGWDCLSQREGQVCENCEKELKKDLEWISVQKVGQKRGREMEELMIQDKVDLKRMVKEFRGRCTLCWMDKREKFVTHELDRCK
jgi:superfamily II DNA helicase RecQ